MKLIFSIMILSFSAHASEVGRFQIVSNLKDDSLTTVLDTSTGKIWTRNCVAVMPSGICFKSVWAIEPVMGITPDPVALKYIRDAGAQAENMKK